MTPVNGARRRRRAASTGTGPVLVVEHTGDNNLVTFRFKLKDVKMSAAEDDFDAGGHKFRAGAIIIPNANARAARADAQGSSASPAWAVASAPTVKTHDLDIPRIGYVHSWSRTQDEGWVRAALDTYGVPYTYFGDKEARAHAEPAREVRRHHLPARRRQRAVARRRASPMTGKAPLPYKKTAETPILGTPDSTDDIRGGMGIEGLMNLVQVRAARAAR